MAEKLMFLLTHFHGVGLLSKRKQKQGHKLHKSVERGGGRYSNDLFDYCAYTNVVKPKGAFIQSCTHPPFFLTMHKHIFWFPCSFSFFKIFSRWEVQLIFAWFPRHQASSRELSTLKSNYTPVCLENLWICSRWVKGWKSCFAGERRLK